MGVGRGRGSGVCSQEHDYWMKGRKRERGRGGEREEEVRELN